MQSINVALTVDELNRIISILGKSPYVEVFELIAKMTQQAQEQLTKLKAEG